jgi:hypothetical protein
MLHTFPVDDFDIQVEEVEVRGIAALRVQVVSGPQGVIRTYSSIRTLLEAADLPPAARRTAERAYQRLAEAAAVAHGKDRDLVTFHEFGSVDSLVELVGCAIALDQLGVERVFASPVPTGFGMVRTEHGMMPIPSPVVMELLRGVPTYSRGIPVELVTATGAAILAAVSEGYGDMPLMRTDRVGYGAGVPRTDFPNMVRVAIGEEQPTGMTARPAASLSDFLSQGDVVVQASAGAMSRAEQGRLLERLERAGAVDAWLTQAVGPDRRSRVIVCAVAPAGVQDAVVQALAEAAGTGPVHIAAVFTVPPSAT